MSWGKPSPWGKMYPGSSSASPWNQHCHWQSFSEKEDWCATKCSQNKDNFRRPRNPLMPSRPPDIGNDGLPPMNVMRHVSLPTTETGLRAVPTFRAEPTDQDMVSTTNHILTDLNMMLTRELAGLKSSIQGIVTVLNTYRCPPTLSGARASLRSRWMDRRSQ